MTSVFYTEHSFSAALGTKFPTILKREFFAINRANLWRIKELDCLTTFPIQWDSDYCQQHHEGIVRSTERHNRSH